MKSTHWFRFCASGVGLFWAGTATYAQVLAFPEAEGFGRFATGGRANLASATVYHVTNLNDSGAGSLRDALSASNRFVVFDVGGIINLNSVVTVASNIYIAGQTAPGGIGVYNNRVAFHGANNLISRYWNVRLGSSQGREDAASLVRGQNMIWDHMSISWGVDGTFDINPDSGEIIDNITIQNSSISQGLDVVGHSTGGLLTIGQGSRSSIIKSLWADNVTRNPKLRGDNEFINNVVYGYQTSGYIMGDTTGMTSNANAMGNYFIEGPIDGSSPFASGTNTFNIYGNDNWVDGDKDGILDGSATSSYPGANVVSTPHAFPSTATMTAQQAVAFVLANFGPNITRDAVDTRLAQEVASYGTLGGVIDRETDLFPNYGTDPVYLNPRARLVDSDNDGMPDNWETSKGYNPSNSADWKTFNGNYTRLEDYLNELGAYGNTKNAPVTGAWTTPATWGGAVPTFATTAVVSNGITQSSGNGFARQLTLDGASTLSGGTIDVFDTTLVGVTTNSSLSVTGATLSAGRILLGATGRTASLTLSSGAVQTGTIASGGGTGSLSLNGGTIRALGTLNISVPMAISGTTATIDTNGYSGQINGNMSGTGPLTKAGIGTLTLVGNNSAYSGPISVASGAITLNSNSSNSTTGVITLLNGTTLNIASSGAGTTTPMSVAASASATLNSFGTYSYNGTITGPSNATLKITGSQTGTNHFSIGSNLTGYSGTLDFTNAKNIRLTGTAAGSGAGSAKWVMADNSALVRTQFGGTVNIGSLTGGTTTSIQGATNDASLTTYSIGALGTSTTFSGTITNGIAATPGLTNMTKVGVGTLTIGNAANTYTGVTTVSGGTLAVGTLANGGVASSLGQSTNVATNLVLDGGTLRYTGAAVAIDRLFSLGAAGGAIDASGTGTLDLNNLGTIPSNASGNRTLTLTGTNTGFNNLRGVIADPSSGATSVTKSGTGTWRLFSSQSYSGNTTVSAGTLYLVALNAIPSGIGKGDVTVASGATLDMYGNNQAINGLNGGGTITTTINTTRNLTIGSGNASGNFTGTFTQGGSQTLNLIKTGTGTQILNGTYNYTGSTTVSGGTLQTIKALQNNSAATINGNGVLDIPANGSSTAVTKVKSLSIPITGVNFLGTLQLHNNDLVIDYTGSSTPFASTLNMLQSGLTLLGGNGTGIASSEVDAQTLQGTMLALVDNGTIGGQITSLSGYNGVTASSVLVKYTWFGDCNLDGTVDGSDYALIDSGFTSGGSLTGWVFGDYDYNNSIDGSDYALIDTGFISQAGVLPEPTMLGLLGIGAITFLRRRR